MLTIIFLVGYLVATLLVTAGLSCIQLYIEKDHVRLRLLLVYFFCGLLWPMFVALILMLLITGIIMELYDSYSNRLNKVIFISKDRIARDMEARMVGSEDKGL